MKLKTARPVEVDDVSFEGYAQEAYDNLQAEEAIVCEYGCCDCGFINENHDGHHRGIRCPHSGRCGSCGNPWPCEEHQVKA